MNKATFTVALLATVGLARNLSANSQQVQDEFEFLQYASANNKQYVNASELKMREENWQKARAQVAELNEKAGGKATFKVNHFSDMTESERQQYLGLPSQPPADADFEYEDFRDGSTPLSGTPLTDTNISWIDHMTPVKTQGNCGSCSAFSATSALEGVQSIKSTEENGTFTPAIRLSEQQGLDCTRTSCAYGGWQQWYYDFAMESGANTNEEYPYTATDGAECLNNPDTAQTWVTEVYNVATAFNDPAYATVENIRAALEEGPLSFAMAAGHDLFVYYEGGVIDATMGCPERMDHAMVIVGYEVIPGEITYEESYDHCDIITKEKTKTKRRCRKTTNEEKDAQMCLADESSAEGDLYWWVNKRGVSRCCYDEEIVKEIEKIDPTCDPIIIETREDDMPVWVIQNSWGTWWGESGFARIEAVDGKGVCHMNFWTQSVSVL